ncbi:hypothetical protein GPECTOR_2g1019 [Gonium pectorale]|uniref:Protein kinase domain-containing protein n=1 Tax=Gonium pectorale TaxID=33097 RepID=A0A150H1M2_GONPE|nr:hypothetical protein GPECTOR_2g1019 [Gonium pectorale]|eukprot:KXZ55470.1 hypothetical protein GPECTOR_2g1019 [Gonium pectorale]
MVLEYLEGGTLKDRIVKSMMLGRRSYSDDVALSWLLDVAEALLFLHSASPPVIHRDIKAENVLLAAAPGGGGGARGGGGGGGRAKLADLGLHVRIEEDRSVMLRRKATGDASLFVAITPACEEGKLLDTANTMSGDGGDGGTDRGDCEASQAGYETWDHGAGGHTLYPILATGVEDGSYSGLGAAAPGGMGLGGGPARPAAAGDDERSVAGDAAVSCVPPPQEGDSSEVGGSAPSVAMGPGRSSIDLSAALAATGVRPYGTFAQPLSVPLAAMAAPRLSTEPPHDVTPQPAVRTPSGVLLLSDPMSNGSRAEVQVAVLPCGSGTVTAAVAGGACGGHFGEALNREAGVPVPQVFAGAGAIAAAAAAGVMDELSSLMASGGTAAPGSTTAPGMPSSNGLAGNCGAPSPGVGTAPGMHRWLLDSPCSGATAGTGASAAPSPYLLGLRSAAEEQGTGGMPIVGRQAAQQSVQRTSQAGLPTSKDGAPGARTNVRSVASGPMPCGRQSTPGSIGARHLHMQVCSPTVPSAGAAGSLGGYRPDSSVHMQRWRGPGAAAGAAGATSAMAATQGNKFTPFARSQSRGMATAPLRTVTAGGSSRIESQASAGLLVGAMREDSMLSLFSDALTTDGDARAARSPLPTAQQRRDGGLDMQQRAGSAAVMGAAAGVRRPLLRDHSLSRPGMAAAIAQSRLASGGLANTSSGPLPFRATAEGGGGAADGGGGNGAAEGFNAGGSEFDTTGIDTTAVAASTAARSTGTGVGPVTGSFGGAGGMQPVRSARLNSLREMRLRSVDRQVSGPLESGRLRSMSRISRASAAPGGIGTLIQASADSFRQHMRRVSSITSLLNSPSGALPEHSEFQWVYGLTGQAGSCMYMAPEVFMRQPYNAKCDVFSFGVLMYELWTHELLIFAYQNNARAARLGIKAPPDYARKVSEGFRPPRPDRFTDAQWELVSRCWHQDPCERPGMAEVSSAPAHASGQASSRRAGRPAGRSGEGGGGADSTKGCGCGCVIS